MKKGSTTQCGDNKLERENKSTNVNNRFYM